MLVCTDLARPNPNRSPNLNPNPNPNPKPNPSRSPNPDQARAEQLRISHEAHELSKTESSLRGEQLRSTMDTLETERARAQRENGVLRLLQQQQQATAATAKGLLAELASERERVALLELRLAERDAHAAASLEELHAAANPDPNPNPNSQP